MEPSANYNITNQMTIRQISLYNPEQDKLAQVLETGLKKHFLTAEVKWVECPDLTQKPFNLAAPGLCGEPAFIDLGDASYLTSPPKMNRVYDIRNILKLLEPPYCGSSNSFIFGNSVFRTTFPEDLFELVINQMMSVTDQEVRDICNRSHTIYTNARRCNVEKIVTLYNYKFNMQGTFFLCQGLTTKSVLQVYAHRPNSQYLDDPSGFINSMQDELQKTFDATGYYVVLGGVYNVTNVFWRHYRKKYDLVACRVKTDTKTLCKMSMPQTIISTFSSTTEFPSSSLEPPIKLNACRSIHSLKHHSAAQSSSTYLCKSNTEYLGYFYPANTLYRIDEPPSFIP